MVAAGAVGQCTIGKQQLPAEEQAKCSTLTQRVLCCGNLCKARGSSQVPAAQEGEPAPHVVILQHGIIGRPKDLKRVRETLLAQLGPKTSSPSQMHVINSNVNTGRTLDGVARGGRRLAKLIKDSVPTMGRLSLVCHSLGGLYARYAVRLLEEEGWFGANRVQPMNFVTLATPHLGIMEIMTLLQYLISLGRCVVGQTLKDLSLRSRVLSEELVDDIALRGLSRFHYLAAYGNVCDDHMVGTGTSLIMANVPSHKDHPTEIPQGCLRCEPSLDHEALPKLFKAKRKEVHYMLRRLSTLNWARYSVCFRPGYLPVDNAHVKICYHCPQDRGKRGKSVVMHICSEFAFETSVMLPDSQAEEPGDASDKKMVTASTHAQPEVQPSVLAEVHVDLVEHPADPSSDVVRESPSGGTTVIIAA